MSDSVCNSRLIIMGGAVQVTEVRKKCMPFDGTLDFWVIMGITGPFLPVSCIPCCEFRACMHACLLA
jgi:hypothetical protein